MRVIVGGEQACYKLSLGVDSKLVSVIMRARSQSSMISCLRQILHKNMNER